MEAGVDSGDERWVVISRGWTGRWWMNRAVDGRAREEEGKPPARCSTIAVSQKPFCGRSMSWAAASAAAHRRVPERPVP